MKRSIRLSCIALGVAAVTLIMSLALLLGTVFFDTSTSLLCISVFLVLIEIEFLLLCFIPIWKLLALLKKNSTGEQFRLAHFLAAIPFFLIGGYLSLWSVSKLYLKANAILKDYRAGIFTYCYQGKFQGWVTYSMDRDYVEFTSEIIFRYFVAGLWGFLLEFGILLITATFAFIIRPTFRSS
ncbi:hypothetical protein [Chryseobacterium sp.]|uniref:hypothetical protein n=1 Tax=Chryseobacterium sp. TaxID=1871047 RepID=UPI001B18D8E6|nr:hypothetical protein [Chryseobacterium sp.]MBO9692097.1 hypothetical protein [Chryseobacterium sp.]